MIRTLAVGAIALGAASGVSQAAFLSFASDTNPAAPTLEATFRPGPGNTLISEFDPTFVDLLIDADEDGPNAAISLGARLSVSLTLEYVGSTLIIGNVYTHAFSVAGFFEFEDAAGMNAWSLRGDVALGEAVFVGLGTNLLVNSASITGFDIAYSIMNVPSLGDGSELPGDFGFTLTNLNGNSGASLVFNMAQEIIGIGDFTAESSFSGRVIPTPGALALAGLGGISLIRRRRAS